MTFKTRIDFVKSPTGFVPRAEDLPERVFRCHYDEATKMMGVTLAPYSDSDRHIFPNVKALFDFLCPASGPVTVVETTGGAIVQIAMMRAANMIASRTRRGSGNVFLYDYQGSISEETLHYIRSLNIETYPLAGFSPNQGMLMYMGTGGAHIVDGELVGRRTRRGHDGPFAAHLRPDGSVEALVLKSESTFLGSSSDYCTMIEITE